MGVHETTGGSTIAVENAQVPDDLRAIEGDGIGFGPVRLTAWADSTVIIGDLTFDEAEPGSWIPLLSAAGLVGAAHHEEHDRDVLPADRRQLTRRGLIATVGAATLFLATGTTSAEDDPVYNVASFDLIQNYRGLKVDVDVGAAEWLEGEDVEFYLSAADSTIGAFEAGEPGKTINPGTNGTVELQSDTALTFLQRLVAKIGADDTVSFEFRPQDTSFAEETVGDQIVISTEPVIVETIKAADEPSRALIRMNETIIPHADERGDKPAGEWYVRDNTALVYVVGPDTPDTSLVEVTANLGWLERRRETLFG